MNPGTDPAVDLLARLDRLCGLIANRVALVAVGAMLVICLLTMVDVLGRWLLNSPITGFYEIAQLLVGVVIAASFPSAIANRTNLVIDFLSASFGEIARRWLSAVGGALMLAFLAVLAWRLGFYADGLASRNAKTINLDVPLAPFWWVVTGLVVGCVLVQAVVLAVQVREALRSPADASTAPHARAVLAVLALVGIGCIAPLLAVPWKSSPLGAIVPDSPAALAGLAFAGVLAVTLLQIPLAAALGLVGLVAMPSVMGGFNPGLVMFGGNSAGLLINLDLATIPLFVMMGGFAGAAGLSTEIYRLGYAFLGHLRGGLAYATIMGCAGFGAVTGSSVATAATIGKVAMPEMEKRNYSMRLAAGSLAAGGTLGMLIPPSTMLVVFAVLTGTSIGTLYIAALVPGVIATIFYLSTVWALARADPGVAPTGPRASAAERLAALRGCWAVLALFGLVLGGLYGGVFTATEAAAVGAGVAFMFALYRRRGHGWRWLPGVLADTAGNTSQIYLLVIGAMAFSSYLGVTQLADGMVEWIKAQGLAPFVVVLCIFAVYLFLGCVMDPITMLLVTIPVVIPLVKDFGYDLVWWGIMTVMVCEVAMITPPLGLNVFVIKAVAGTRIDIRGVFAGVMPFVGADVLRLLLLAAFPILTLWLPATMRP